MRIGPVSFPGGQLPSGPRFTQPVTADPLLPRDRVVEWLDAGQGVRCPTTKRSPLLCNDAGGSNARIAVRNRPTKKKHAEACLKDPTVETSRRGCREALPGRGVGGELALRAGARLQCPSAIVRRRCSCSGTHCRRLCVGAHMGKRPLRSSCELRAQGSCGERAHEGVPLTRKNPARSTRWIICAAARIVGRWRVKPGLGEM